jgi:hypothetical protein
LSIYFMEISSSHDFPQGVMELRRRHATSLWTQTARLEQIPADLCRLLVRGNVGEIGFTERELAL